MIHWFKRHPKHLAAESTALSNDNNYKEVYQVRENLFISHGNILVRLDKIYRFPILIVYPEATPYVLPSIYPLKQILPEELVNQLAKGTVDEVHNTIVYYVEFHYNLRHQNQSGILCILEWDNLDNGSAFYGITTILKRVRDWFAGLITGNFPLDSQEVDFCSHFNNVDSQYRFMYPESFLNEKFVEGEAYGTLFHHLPKGYFEHDRWTYFGCLMIGKTESGIFQDEGFTLPTFFFEEGITNALELVNKKDTVKRLVENNKLLKFSWFQIQNEPTPFRTLTELLNILGEGEYDKGLSRIMPFYLEGLKLKPSDFFIGFRFANRKGTQEFQIFRVLKKGETTGGLIGASEAEAFKHLIESYDTVYAIPSEKFTEETYHQRNSGRANREVLKSINVNIVGVGALGSEIADILGKAGIGTLSLFDNQEMKGPNPVRHLVGLNYVGTGKVFAVRDSIRNHNPFINVQAYPYNIYSFDLNDFFKDDSITVSSIADDNTEGFLNERAVIGDKVVFYVRALRGAKVARIFRVIPGKDACFNCLDLYRKEGSEFINIPEDKDLPTIKNECNNPIRPASAADLKLISALSSRIILDELQKGFGEINHWIWSTEAISGLERFQVNRQFIPPHSNCYYCNHEKKIEIHLVNKVEEQMQAMIAENPRIETGGVLAGRIDEYGNFIITHASEPGPKAVRTATKFEKDVEYCQKFLDDLFISSNKEVVYLGEWHSHPSKNNHPSGTDINSLTKIAFQKEYLTDMPAMIIFSNKGEPSCTVHPAGKRYYFSELKVI